MLVLLPRCIWWSSVQMFTADVETCFFFAARENVVLKNRNLVVNGEQITTAFHYAHYKPNMTKLNHRMRNKSLDESYCNTHVRISKFTPNSFVIKYFPQSNFFTNICYISSVKLRNEMINVVQCKFFKVVQI